VLGPLEATIEHIYTQVNPSVVNIRVVQRQEVRYPVLPEIPFFGSPLPRGPQEFIRRGLGSGFVWDHDGYIVTNNHLVDGADCITVTFHDGTTVSAKVVGTDPESDLAVVKVDLPAEQLEPVRMADSTQVKVGQLALAFGNPFGLQSTMTVGFISALGRILPVESGDGDGPSYTIPTSSKRTPLSTLAIPEGCWWTMRDGSSASLQPSFLLWGPRSASALPSPPPSCRKLCQR
jgi:S1-C subfamily serine protease